MKKLIMLMLVSGVVSVSARADGSDDQKPKIGLNKGVANCTQVIQQVTEDVKRNRPVAADSSSGTQSGSDSTHSAQ